MDNIPFNLFIIQERDFRINKALKIDKS